MKITNANEKQIAQLAEDLLKSEFWRFDEERDRFELDRNRTARNLCKIGYIKVVKCKDCKYWQDNNGGYPHEECRWGKNETPDADDYCSYGERR